MVLAPMSVMANQINQSIQWQQMATQLYQECQSFRGEVTMDEIPFMSFDGAVDVTSDEGRLSVYINKENILTWERALGYEQVSYLSNEGALMSTRQSMKTYLEEMVQEMAPLSIWNNQEEIYLEHIKIPEVLRNTLQNSNMKISEEMDWTIKMNPKEQLEQAVGNMRVSGHKISIIVYFL